MKYINMALVFAVMYSVPYAGVTLACIIALFSAIYYKICFDLSAGLKSSFIPESTTSNLQSTTISVGSNVVSVAALIMQTPYAWIGYMALPWIIITISTMTLGWLIHYEFVEINNKDDE